jgi:sugar lactone lactonase YvrE
MLGKFLTKASSNYSPGWDISSAKSPGVFSAAAQDTAIWGLFLSPNGRNMYVLGNSREVNQYTLSIPWDISYASYTRTISITAQISYPTGLYFSTDGIYMYVSDYNSADVNQYTLSTAWDISSATFTRSLSITDVSGVAGVFFTSDGNTMYLIGYATGNVAQYTLSTAWNISSASYIRVFSVAAQAGNASDLYFSPDGTHMYVSGYSVSNVAQYTLSTAWDISSASYVRQFSTSAPSGLFLRPNGTSIYTLNYNTRIIEQRILSTEWDISTAKLPGFFNTNAQETAPEGIFFKPDGTSMYLIGSTGDDVNQYTLSTAWDISSASYTRVFSVAAQEIVPTGIFFKPDGTSMYIVGSTGDDVNQYTLSTAWDISSASYTRVFSVAAQENVPSGIFFKPDGTSMYIIGETGDDVNQYTLSTAWDISSATYTRVFSVSDRAINPTAIFFSKTGKKMFVVGGSPRNVFSYTI